MMWLWVLIDAVILGLFGVALMRFQTAPKTSSRVMAGVAAPMLGLMGIVLLVAVLFG